MLINDAKPRIAAAERRATRDTAGDMKVAFAQRGKLEQAFYRLLAGSSASAALADLLAPSDDQRVH